MAAYRCPGGAGFHYGHLAPGVTAGLVDRAELYGRTGPREAAE